MSIFVLVFIIIAVHQVLQTDIESHGRIVKLVLGLCQVLIDHQILYLHILEI